MTVWGKLIRDLRAEQGLSKRKLALESGVNRSTLRRLEDGKTTGPINVIEDILAVLGYELDAIKVREPGQEITVEERPGTPNPADLMERWRRDRLESHRARYGG